MYWFIKFVFTYTSGYFRQSGLKQLEIYSNDIVFNGLSKFNPTGANISLDSFYNLLSYSKNGISIIVHDNGIYTTISDNITIKKCHNGDIKIYIGKYRFYITKSHMWIQTKKRLYEVNKEYTVGCILSSTDTIEVVKDNIADLITEAFLDNF